MAKDTIIEQNFSLRLKGKSYSMSSPKVMGILNITPDSFFDGGKYQKIDDLLRKADQHLNEGCFLLDVGAASSRPGATLLSASEEWLRLEPALTAIIKNFPDALISVDTYHSKVAENAINLGAAMINDISAGSLDPNMFSVISKSKVPYALMHMKGNPMTMQKESNYSNIIEEMTSYFKNKILELNKLDCNSNLIIDLGFGFSKKLSDNYYLLNHLKAFDSIKAPMIIGLSRKSMFYKPLNTSAAEALNATTVGHTIALMQKRNLILRVHDVKPAVEAIKIVTLAQNPSSWAF